MDKNPTVNNGDEPSSNDSLAEQATILLKLLKDDKVTDILNKLKGQTNVWENLTTTLSEEVGGEVDDYLEELTNEVTQTVKRGPP